MPKLDKLWIKLALTVFFLAFHPGLGRAQTDLRTLTSGIWVGAVRSNEQGVASSCYLSAQKSNKEFWILLKFDGTSLHVILYNENWRLNKGDTYQSRVRIDRLFDSLVTATNIDSTAIDFFIGNDEPSFESVQAGRQISLETQNGIRKFKLQGTRKAVNTLIDCADTYLTTAGDGAVLAQRAPDYGTGVAAYTSKDYGGALGQWLPLAKEGHAKSQNAVGILYYNGQGVAKDRERAAEWFRRAADQNYDRAQNNLGEMYRDGEGVPQDDAKAVRLFRDAVAQGHEKARNNLDDMLADGRGIAEDANPMPGIMAFVQALPTSGGRAILHPGDEVQVGFTAPKGQDRYSWIGFVLDDAVADPTPQHYVQQSIDNRIRGIMTLEVPAMLGNYRLWMYDGRNRKVLAEQSVRIEVDKDSAGLDLPGGARLEPGQDFEVNFRASPAYNFYVWVNIVGPDAPIDVAEEDIPRVEYIGHQRLDGKTAGTLTFTAPKTPGRYWLRMQDPEWAKTLTQVEIVVVAPAAPEAPPTPGLAQPSPASAPTVRPIQETFAPGAGVQVQFSGLPAKGQDWLAISKRGDDPKQYYDLIMLTGKPTEGTHTFKPLPAGDYEVRLYTNWPDGGYDIVARSVVSVGEKPAPALPAAPLAIPAPAPAQPIAPISPTAGKKPDTGVTGAGKTTTVTGTVGTPTRDSETAPGQASGNAQLAAVQQVIDEMSALPQPMPQPSASGGPVLDPVLARYNHLYVTFGGEHRITEEETQFSMPEEKDPSGNVIVDNETKDTVSYTGFFNFSTNLASGYFSVVPQRLGAGVNTDQDKGFGCYLQTGGLTWNGTVFSYSLNEGKVEAADARNVYCRIEIVGVVAPDGSALQLLTLIMQASVTYLSPETLDTKHWNGAVNTYISYNLQNLPIDVEETYGTESPEDQNVDSLKYADCTSFFGAGESASSYIAYLGLDQAFYGRFDEPPKFVSSIFQRFYDSMRWTGEIKRVAGRDKGDSVTPGVRVELCRN